MGRGTFCQQSQRDPQGIWELCPDIFVILQEDFDLDGDQILRALTTFPGIALRGETCGAGMGCPMALGLKFWAGRPQRLEGIYRVPSVSSTFLYEVRGGE